MRRTALWIGSIAASVVALGVILQVYFIAAWIFGASGALDAHRTNAIVVWILGIVVGLAGLVAYWRSWRTLAVWVALPVLMEIQIFFVGDVEDPSKNESGWLHGFHGGLAILVFLLAVLIASRGFEQLRARDRRAVAEA